MIEINSSDIEVYDKGDKIEYYHRPSDLHYECYKTVTDSRAIFYNLIQHSWWPTSRIDKALVTLTRVFGSARIAGILYTNEAWAKHLETFDREKDEVFLVFQGLEYYINQAAAYKSLWYETSYSLTNLRAEHDELAGINEALEAEVLALQKEVCKTPAWYRRIGAFLFAPLCRSDSR